MEGMVLSILQPLSHLISQSSYEADIIIIPIL